MKEGTGRIASDAQEALEWLDEASTLHPDLITLQGGFDKFEKWEDVEKYARPTTLFSEDNHTDEVSLPSLVISQAASLQLEDEDPKVGQSFSSIASDSSRSTLHSRPSIRSVSPLSPPVSPTKQTMEPVALSQRPSNVPSPADAQHHRNDRLQVPSHIRPLLNYIIWRVHQETDPSAALDAFIFLTDNAATKKHAQKFGIRTKTLGEIRYVIARESKDARNRQVVQRSASVQPGGASSPDKSSEQSATHRSAKLAASSIEDDDEIVFRRSPMTNPGSPKPFAGGLPAVMDPDKFDRQVKPRSNTGGNASIKGSPRGNNTRRGGKASSRGRGQVATHVSTTPIDPNSFTRSDATQGNGRGARGSRHLWIPT